MGFFSLSACNEVWFTAPPVCKVWRLWQRAVSWNWQHVMVAFKQTSWSTVYIETVAAEKRLAVVIVAHASGRRNFVNAIDLVQKNWKGSDIEDSKCAWAVRPRWRMAIDSRKIEGIPGLSLNPRCGVRDCVSFGLLSLTGHWEESRSSASPRPV